MSKNLIGQGWMDYILARIENRGHFLNFRVKGHFGYFDHRWASLYFSYFKPPLVVNISNIINLMELIRGIFDTSQLKLLPSF